LAAEKGYSQLVFHIITSSTEQLSEDRNPGDEYGITPLHKATENGHFEIVQIIMNHCQANNNNPKDQDEGNTPLHIATEHGHMQIVDHIKINRGQKS